MKYTKYLPYIILGVVLLYGFKSDAAQDQFQRMKTLTQIIRLVSENYVEEANDQMFLAVQIESKLGLQNANEIMSVEGIDGCWIGPNDLAKSMGLDLQSSEGLKKHTDAIHEIVEICKQNHKIPGISTGSSTVVKPWIEQGCLFVTAGYDDGWVIEGAKRTLTELGR
mgnify:CR=1 FL=1